MPPELPPLTEWETFYVIIGSSAAALTGLQFVVIALGAEAKVLAGEPEMKAFGTPPSCTSALSCCSERSCRRRDRRPRA